LTKAPSTPNPLLHTYTLAFLINFMQFVQPATTRTACCTKKNRCVRGGLSGECGVQKGGLYGRKIAEKWVVRWERNFAAMQFAGVKPISAFLM